MVTLSDPGDPPETEEAGSRFGVLVLFRHLLIAEKVLPTKKWVPIPEGRTSSQQAAGLGGKTPVAVLEMLNGIDNEAVTGWQIPGIHRETKPHGPPNSLMGP